MNVDTTTIPLAILTELEEFSKHLHKEFKYKNSEDAILTAYDCQVKDSPYFFKITRMENGSSGRNLAITRSPYDTYTTQAKAALIPFKNLKAYFKEWIDMIQRHKSLGYMFEDPIVESFSDYFFTEFTFVDEDADKKPFNTSEILLLEEYLERMDQELAQHITEENQLEMQEIQEDISDLRENLSNETKNQILKRLSFVWGKIAKHGKPYITIFLTEARKEIITQLTKGAINLIIE